MAELKVNISGLFLEMPKLKNHFSHLSLVMG
jgi:hypothetical protein